MNKEAIVAHMISYIEEEEKNLQAALLSSETKSSKADIVNHILKELESEMADED